MLSEMCHFSSLVFFPPLSSQNPFFLFGTLLKRFFFILPPNSVIPLVHPSTFHQHPFCSVFFAVPCFLLRSPPVLKMQISQSTTTPSTHPLNLPEIRARISCFLRLKDCTSCMRVSRDWFKDFAPAVWRTIDFKDGDSNARGTSALVDKYGGLITHAFSISSLKHIQTLQHAKVNALQTVQVKLTDNCNYRELAWDLISRCGGSIRTMELHCDPPSPDSVLKQQTELKYFIRLNDMSAAACLSPSTSNGEITTSRGNWLTSLRLEYVCLTREGFSSMLQRSPSLDRLVLNRAIIVGHSDSVPLYTGSCLRYLSASLNQIYAFDIEDPDAPCLLLHFPLLQGWDILWMHRPSRWTTNPVREEFSSWCPHLKTITFGTKGTELISSLLINTFETLETCTITGECLTSSTALGLIAHKDTLTSIVIKDKTPQNDWRNWFQMIPRLCLHLQVLSLEPLSFDSETLDSFQWGCKDLRELRVRISDIGDGRQEAADGIDECLAQLCDWRRFGVGASLIRFKGKESITTSVCHFLFQFKKLRTVWLGTKDYYLPPSRL